MKAVALWVARQFDGGLTLAGALIALVLMGTGVGALIGLASGSLAVLAVLGVPFLILLCVAFLAAHHTAPSVRMSQEEKRARWEQAPAFVRWALYIFGTGAIGGVLLDGRLGHFVAWALIAVSALVMAEGVRRERPPLPRAEGGPVTERASPSEYNRIWKQTLWGSYVSAGASALFALLAWR